MLLLNTCRFVEYYQRRLPDWENVRGLKPSRRLLFFERWTPLFLTLRSTDINTPQSFSAKSKGFSVIFLSGCSWCYQKVCVILRTVSVSMCVWMQVQLIWVFGIIGFSSSDGVFSQSWGAFLFVRCITLGNRFKTRESGVHHRAPAAYCCRRPIHRLK